MTSGFAGLITSKTRVAIIMRLFLNPRRGAYLRELASEIGCSTSQVSGELKQLSQAGFLCCEQNGRQLRYQANTTHALFPELHSMVRKALGMDRILDSIIRRLGALERALLLDDYAEGKDTGIIDLLLVGDIDQRNLVDLVAKTERHVDRKIRTLCLSRNEYDRMLPQLDQRPQLLLWNAGDAVDAADGSRLDVAGRPFPGAAPPVTQNRIEDRPDG